MFWINLDDYERFFRCLGVRNDARFCEFHPLSVVACVLVRYKAKQFIGIMTDAEVIDEFDLELYFDLVAKMTVYDDGRLVVSLLDGTEVECGIQQEVSVSKKCIVHEIFSMQNQIQPALAEFL